MCQLLLVQAVTDTDSSVHAGLGKTATHVIMLARLIISSQVQPPAVSILG